MKQGVDFIEEGENSRHTVTDRAISENRVTSERKKRFLLLVDGNALVQSPTKPWTLPPA